MKVVWFRGFNKLLRVLNEKFIEIILNLINKDGDGGREIHEAVCTWEAFEYALPVYEIAHLQAVDCREQKSGLLRWLEKSAAKSKLQPFMPDEPQRPCSTFGSQRHPSCTD